MQSPLQASHDDSILPLCIQTRTALDLSYKPSFRFVQTERSHLAVSQSNDPVLKAFFDGSAKWLYLNKKTSRGHKIALTNGEVQLLDEYLHNLVSAGIIVKCKRNGFISYLFFRAKPCGQPRMLIDYSHLRGSTRLPKFCLPSFLSQLRSHPVDLRGWWAVRIDLKDAFYSVALPRRLQPITNFRAGNSTYQFRALPMGLQFSPWILQRVVNSRLNKLCKSFPLLFAWAHVDDIILAANTCDQCKSGIRVLIHLLNDAGFYISWKKSQVLPTQRISYCGLSLNFSGGQFNVQEAFRCLLKETLLHTSDKVNRRVLLQLLHQNHPQSKYWQWLLGKVTYLLYTIGFTSAFRWWTMMDATRLALARLINAGPWPLPRPPERLWASDATTKCIAVVEQHGHPVEIKRVAGLIYDTELFALWRATELAPPNTAIFVDNQAVLGSLRHTRASRMLTFLTSFNKVIKNLHIAYIKSEHNPADWYTRHPPSDVQAAPMRDSLLS